MRNILAATFLAILVSAPAPARAVMSVTLDSGLGSVLISDDDDDCQIVVDETVAGTFAVSGIMKCFHDTASARIAISPLLLESAARFTNVSAAPQTFTVTVRLDPLSTAFAPPVGWDIFYNGSVDDTVDFVVDMPSHSVQGFVDSEAVLLGTINGAPYAAPSAIEYDLHGVHLADPADDMTIVWTFQLGPNDEISLPSDDDFEGESLQFNVFNQTQKCIDKMNNAARQVANTSQKDDQKCLKTTGVDTTVCVDNPAEEKTEKKESKLVESFAGFCNPLPAWGANGDGCCDGGAGDGTTCVDSGTCGGGTCLQGECIAAAADTGTNDLIHDLFGASVVISADKATYKCQQAVWKSLGQLYVERWKQFRGCKRDNFATIVDDPTLKSTCLEPQPDLKNKISKRTAKVSDIVQKKCLDQGLVGLAAVFPGECSAEPDAAVGTCAAGRAACRFCQSVNSADAIDPAEDCDLFDDSVVNGSCP